jgi:non-heme chloroperoxidase
VNRRSLLEGVAIAGAGITLAAASGHVAAQSKGAPPTSSSRPPFVTTKDGMRLFVQDWGTGRPVILLSAWTFNSSVWGSYIAALNAAGFRCIAPDRRGHGRSDTPMSGYDLDTLTDDVAAVIEQRGLKDALLLAHSMGTIEAVNYLARYGSDRIAKLILAAPTTPYLVQTGDNPDAVPRAMIDAQTQTIAADYPKWIADNEAPFFTPDTPMETRVWIKAMMLSVALPVALACRATISSADLRTQVARIDRPTLILHGNKDASAPLALTGAKTAKLIKRSKFVVYEGAPHALTLTHRERFMGDVLSFIAA